MLKILSACSCILAGVWCFFYGMDAVCRETLSSTGVANCFTILALGVVLGAVGVLIIARES